MRVLVATWIVMILKLQTRIMGNRPRQCDQRPDLCAGAEHASCTLYSRGNNGKTRLLLQSEHHDAIFYYNSVVATTTQHWEVE